MRLAKPSWLVHEDQNRRFEIYSLHVSPDGKRLATGGLDAKVRIWSTSAIAAEVDTSGVIGNTTTESASSDALQATKKYNGNRQLSSMSTHSGAVTVVRFSPNGRYLASGSDDKIALIWELDTTRIPRQEFGSKGEKDSEVWTARKRLAGHESDIQDLAWSPDGSLLVTVGLDSAIIVWSGTTFEKLKRIDSHQSHVKGVTFDPANKYFVTVGDDRSARVIRYQRASPSEMTFNVEAIVESPFKESPLSTYFRRCSWAPNGEYIACANATNGPVPSVAIINRGEWDSEISLIGHEGPCEVATFSPRLYSRVQNPDLGKFNVQDDAITVVASGGQDRTLAIWNTSNPRPLLVAKNIAEKTISDIAWAPDGQTVYASSLDGTALVASFDSGDLGYALDSDLAQAQLQKYGGASNDMDIPESAEQVVIEERFSDTSAKLGDAATAAELVDTVMEDVLSENATEQASTVETTTSTPNIPATDAQGLAKTMSVPGKSFVEPENKQKTLPDPPLAATTSVIEAPAASPLQTAAPAPAETHKQKVSITKDGRKRVAPTLITQEVADPRISSTPSAPSLVQTATTPMNGSATRAVAEMSRPSHALPQGGVSSLVIGNKRKPLDEESGAAPATSAKKQKEQTGFIRPAVINPATVVAQVRLATPKVFTHISTDKDNSAVLEIRNGETTNDPARIVVVRNGAVVFIDFVSGYVHLLTGSADYFWAVSTEEGAVYIYSPLGRRLMPPLILGSALSILEANEQLLVAITSTGLVHAWDIMARKALFPATSLAPVLDTATKYAENGLLKAPTVTQCMLVNGRVLVTLSNGTAHTYDPEMMTWQRVSEPFWAYGSQYWDSTGFASLLEGSSPGSGAVMLAERRTNEEALLRAGARGKQLQRMAKNRMLQDGYQGFEDVVSLAHLENRLNSAIVLNSRTEISKFFEMYVRQLAEGGHREKLNELFNDLLEGGEGNLNCSKLAGIERHVLLQNSLRVASKYRSVQTLVAEYDEALSLARN